MRFDGEKDQARARTRTRTRTKTRPGPGGEKRRREGKRGKKARGERQMNPSGFERMVG